MGISFIQLDKVNISQDVLSDFNCGHPDFNSFLREDAISLAAEGEGVTYVLVDDEEIDNELSCSAQELKEQIEKIVMLI